MTSSSLTSSESLLTAPVPVLATRPPWRETFASLKVPNYRLYAGAQVVATTALGMQRVAQDWLVLQLSGSVAAVGVTVAMQFAPMLIFGLLGGVIADRYSKRMLLMLTQSTAALLAAVLAVLILTGTVQVWHIWALAFIGGFVTVVDNPARQVFVNEIVGPRLLRNAISLNSSTFQLGALIGPAVGGIAITAVGSGWAFAINSAACIVVVCALGFMNTKALLPAPMAPRGKGQLAEGLRYAAHKPAILFTIITLGAVAMFAYTMPVLLAAYANDVFKVGSAGYGFFNALVAVGALTGAVLSTRRLGVSLRLVIGGAALLGVVQASAALSPDIVVFGVLIAASGAASLLFLTSANSLVQMSTNLGIRGRVMALYIMVQLGGQAIGGPVMGWIVERYGPAWGLAVSGIVPLATAIALALLVMRRAHLRVTVCRRGRMPSLAVVSRD
ncbi:MFS transporter [Humibacter sp. RRB41]|uniref:MFS transporter n=1 Tax=Humibacter sp. RRB41 TaxID=2919946 RepID=UPI001FA95275|nr:MFS transporter [Humibacter sp. RRB41]